MNFLAVLVLAEIFQQRVGRLDLAGLASAPKSAGTDVAKSNGGA